MFDDTPRRRKSGHFMKSSWRDALRQGCCQGVQLPSHSENHGKEVLFDWEQCADIANQRAVIRRDQGSTFHLPARSNQVRRRFGMHVA